MKALVLEEVAGERKQGGHADPVGCFPVEHFGPRCVTLSLQMT